MNLEKSARNKRKNDKNFQFGIGILEWLLFLGNIGPSFVNQEGGRPVGWASAFGHWCRWLGSGVGFPSGGGLGTSIKSKTYQSCCWWWVELGGDV